jgi:hypothetical protein
MVLDFVPRCPCDRDPQALPATQFQSMMLRELAEFDDVDKPGEQVIARNTLSPTPRLKPRMVGTIPTPC